ncbi:hypothetical protein DL95DRAFT_496613 [Leptodontidium sp. 2 PMI_412]|nr:hypothetical protein DL95DRAFT_496613 [Leptodontidium sp. 2 PMI_412]
MSALCLRLSRAEHPKSCRWFSLCLILYLGGTAYVRGGATSVVPRPPQGSYTLKGKVTRAAKVVITDNVGGVSIKTIGVRYVAYSDDGLNFLSGYENFTRTSPNPILEVVDWYSDLKRTGKTSSTKKTSSNGFHLSIDVISNIFEANGTLSTTVDGKVYLQPLIEPKQLPQSQRSGRCDKETGLNN